MTTTAMSALQQVPLNDFHVKQGGRMVPFAGFNMPVQYTSILEEHRVVREKVGLFDVSHMGEARVEGPQSEAFLDYLFTADITKLKEGAAVYSLLCYPEGGVVDDLIVYRLGVDKFFLCLNASNTDKDIAWMQEHISSFDCQLTNCSSEYGQLALQGPLATKIIDALIPQASEDIKRFTAQDVLIQGIPVYASRTGYTGEDGFEFYLKASETEALATILMEAGQPYGIQLAGLGARDSLRLEVGYPLYGHEIGSDISPLEAGLGWAVKLKKAENFIGKAALIAQKEAGLKRKVVHYTLEDKRIAREGTVVMDGERQVGQVLSGAMSPIINQPIGSALIGKAAMASEHLFVDIRGKRFPITVKKPPLHKA